MEQSDFDDLIAHARQAGHVLKTVFHDLSDEELDLESAVRHYPLVALGLAASAGALAGWWVGRRGQSSLPPPIEEPEADNPRPEGSYLESLLPQLGRVRNAVPDAVADEAAAMARNWMDTVLEPKLKQSLDSVAKNVGDTRFGSLLKQATQRMDSHEDVQLEDPEDLH